MKKVAIETLILSEEEVKRLLSIEEVMIAVEEAFRMKGLGLVQMPSKQYLCFNKYNGDLRTMPSYLEQNDVVAVKIVNSHSENPLKHGLPTVMAIIIVINPKTGAPLAIISGTWITALRTGVAGAIAAKYLANENPKTIGFIGAGVQAKTQLMGLLNFYKHFETIKVWSRTKKSRKRFVEEMKNLHPISEIMAVNTVAKAVQESDIVVTTTPSTEPIVFRKWVNEGTHFNCIGADAAGKQELEPAILVDSKIVVDDWDQGCHSGEINVPLANCIISEKNIWGDICEIVAGLKPGRSSTDEITVFTSTGLAIQDAATANIVYQKALKEKIGKKIDILNI